MGGEGHKWAPARLALESLALALERGPLLLGRGHAALPVHLADDADDTGRDGYQRHQAHQPGRRRRRIANVSASVGTTVST